MIQINGEDQEDQPTLDPVATYKSLRAALKEMKRPMSGVSSGGISWSRSITSLSILCVIGLVTVDGQKWEPPRTLGRVSNLTAEMIKYLPQSWIGMARRTWRNLDDLYGIKIGGIQIKQEPFAIKFTKTTNKAKDIEVRCPGERRSVTISKKQSVRCVGLEEDTTYYFGLQFLIRLRKGQVQSREFIVELQTAIDKVATTATTRQTVPRPKVTPRRPKWRHVPWGRDQAQEVTEVHNVAEPLLENPEETGHQVSAPKITGINTQTLVKGEGWGVQNATMFAGALALSLAALSTLVGLILWQRLEKSKNEEMVQFPLRRIERDVIR